MESPDMGADHGRTVLLLHTCDMGGKLARERRLCRPSSRAAPRGAFQVRDCLRRQTFPGGRARDTVARAGCRGRRQAVHLSVLAPPHSCCDDRTLGVQGVGEGEAPLQSAGVPQTF